jgi:hypothetical protein
MSFFINLIIPKIAMQYYKASILLVITLATLCATASAQYARVVFFRGYSPFNSDFYRHKIKITDANEGQYARPHTIYAHNYIRVGMLRARSVMVYDYLQPTPSFYAGHDLRHQVTPADTIQLIQVTNRTYFFQPRFRFTTCNMQHFKELYAHKKWLQKKLAKCGYKSVNELLKITEPGS